MTTTNASNSCSKRTSIQRVQIPLGRLATPLGNASREHASTGSAIIAAGVSAW
jgi:hypothetical protein